MSKTWRPDGSGRNGRRGSADDLFELLMAAGAAVAGPGRPDQFLDGANSQVGDGFNDLRLGDL